MRKRIEQSMLSSSRNHMSAKGDSASSRDDFESAMLSGYLYSEIHKNLKAIGRRRNRRHVV